MAINVTDSKIYVFNKKNKIKNFIYTLVLPSTAMDHTEVERATTLNRTAMVIISF
jgi:hypothetical protein